jgi:ribonuclease PH
MNVVMTGQGNSSRFRVQPRRGLTKKEMDGLTRLAQKGIGELTRVQKKSLEGKG